MITLDGQRMAVGRQEGLRSRSRVVTVERGRPPRLALVAFTDEGGVAPHVTGKIRACASVGVDAVPVLLPAGTSTDEAAAAITRAIKRGQTDAVFLQFPFPDGVDGEALSALLPEGLDVDVMSPGRIRDFMVTPDALPPVTVSAGLALLDAYGVDVAGRSGSVVSEPGAFSIMFRKALVRRGVKMRALLSPVMPGLPGALRDDGLVVVAASRPGLVSSLALSPGAVAIDAGYYNAGGRGDIDTSGGVDHLEALGPVPGGIGPMTISMLAERVIEMAARY